MKQPSFFTTIPFLAIGILAFGLVPTTEAAEEDASFYTRAPIFSTRPSTTPSRQVIARFGPVGMAIALVQPAFRMQIAHIEADSPAAATGTLKKGQFIVSINGEPLADIDPRIQLGNLITKAEATDGRIVLRVKDTDDAPAREVVVRIPVLGSYSDTWPLDCPKSDRIVRNFADYLAREAWKDGRCGLNGPALLFLLSTGEERDLETARKWVKKTVAFYRDNPAPFKNWRIGYGGVPLAEYYLRTGDKAVLPVIQKYADLARDHHYLGGWAHGGTGLFPYMSGGHMNAAGAHVLSFLLLAKECGVEVDETTLQHSLRQFYRFAGRGLTPYGDQRPESGYVDNGKCGKLAFAMSAAASLTPDGWNSLYADAARSCAMKSYTTTPWMNHGHTGGGVGEVWRSFAMGLLYEQRPAKYRDFMETRRWFYELSRRYNGSFGILGGGRYDGRLGTTPTWGHTMALSYTAPRKTLQITGAPDTPYSKKYELPERPWGTQTDDAFLSLDPATDTNGNTPDFSSERLAVDSARRVLVALRAPDITRATIRRYVHHPDHGVRRSAVQRAAGMTPLYMGAKPPRKALFPDLITEFLAADDPRVRWAGAYAVTLLPHELLTDENASLLFAMIENARESWWVVDRAMQAVAAGAPETIAPHIDRLVHFLGHREWWLQNSALKALMPVMTKPQHYGRIFPAVSELIAKNQRFATLGPLKQLSKKLQTSDARVQAAAVTMLADAYLGFSPKEQKRVIPNADGEKWHLQHLAEYLADCPGGLEKLLEVSRERFPDEVLPHRGLFLARAERGNLSPTVEKALRPIILTELIPKHVGQHYNQLVELASSTRQDRWAGGRNEPLDELAKLYAKTGINEYQWEMYADLREKTWWYHTFDPIPKDQVAWDQLITRFRNVTLPEGMDNWYKPDFDPQNANWKRGKGAFGQYNGKVPEFTGKCTGPPPHCFCRTSVHTLWDKEVLLFRGTFDIPELDPDTYRYRLRVNTGDHVGKGGGYAVYVNGKRIARRGRCPRRGEGGLPKGSIITRKWLQDFNDGPVTLAATSFLRYNSRYAAKPKRRVPQGVISLHIERMKVPPFDHEMVVKSAHLVPMLTAEWQAKQFPAHTQKETIDEVAVRQGTAPDGKFRYDGTFQPNPDIMGQWTFLGQVESIEDFTPDDKLESGRPHFRDLTFNPEGRTQNPALFWTGDTLMNLERYEALRIRKETIDDEPYLFVEAGGFHRSAGKRVGWTAPWNVMTRPEK